MCMPMLSSGALADGTDCMLHCNNDPAGLVRSSESAEWNKVTLAEAWS